MMPRPTLPTAPTDPGGEPGASIGEDVRLFDTTVLRRHLRRAAGAVRRRPFTAAVALGMVLAFGSVTWLAAPDRYQSTAVVSVRSNVVSSSIANPNRSVPNGAEQPLVNARETILSRENLDKIIEDAGLVERVHAGESGLGRQRRQLLERAFGTPTPEMLQEQVRRDLSMAITVSVDGGSSGPESLSISVLWSTPTDANRIVELAVGNFLDQRHIAAVGPIEDALAIVQSFTSEVQAEVVRLRAELNFPESDIREIPVGSPLRAAIDNEVDLETRLRSAQIELQSAEAAFKYTYQVVQPGELPTSPTSSPMRRIAMTVVLSMLAMAGSCLLRDSRARGKAARRMQSAIDCGRVHSEEAVNGATQPMPDPVPAPAPVPAHPAAATNPAAAERSARVPHHAGERAGPALVRSETVTRS